jgi:hypothetical protein
MAVLPIRSLYWNYQNHQYYRPYIGTTAKASLVRPRGVTGLTGDSHRSDRWCPGATRECIVKEYHYVKTSNRSHNICTGPLTPVTSTHICNGCCLAPVTYKRVRTSPGLASTTPVTNVDFW